MSADSIAICAVSRSRISPTMITSGSARSSERSPAAKVSPVFGFTCTCLMPVELVLHRVLDGHDRLVGRVQLGRAPRTASSSCRSRSGRSRGSRRASRAERSRSAARSSSSIPRPSRSMTICARVEDAHHDRLAAHGRAASPRAGRRSCRRPTARCGRPAARASRRCRARP